MQPGQGGVIDRSASNSPGTVGQIDGRGEDRTSGPCLPKTVLYQAELLPDRAPGPIGPVQGERPPSGRLGIAQVARSAAENFQPILLADELFTRRSGPRGGHFRRLDRPPILKLVELIPRSPSSAASPSLPRLPPSDPGGIACNLSSNLIATGRLVPMVPVGPRAPSRPHKGRRRSGLGRWRISPRSS